MTFALLNPSAYRKNPQPPLPGSPPRMEWLPIAALGVDDEYQRPIGARGRANIDRISAHFAWTKFGPVIVAPAGSNRYAIVDGQHRTLAAAINGYERVPCYIIAATLAEQAQSFSAVNGATTKLTPLQVYHAAVAAGEPWAVRVAGVVQRADVKILRHQISAQNMKRGETISTRVFHQLIERHGPDVVSGALAMITQVADGNAGQLQQHVMTAYADVLARHPEWQAGHGVKGDVLDALDDFPLANLAAQSMAERRGMGNAWKYLALCLEARLKTALTEAA